MSVAAQVQETDPRYPIGRFKKPETISPEDRASAIAAIAAMPGLLKAAVHGLDRDQLDTPYREGGWTVRQTVHHYADSHMNAFVRLRLALTEDWPTILPYDEKAWAMLRDCTGAPVGWSLDLIGSLHARWVMVLDSLGEEQWSRGFQHPENGPMSIELQAQLYAWHSKHHVAHITRLREQKGW
jgi:hypothetical protein